MSIHAKITSEMGSSRTNILPLRNAAGRATTIVNQVFSQNYVLQNGFLKRFFSEDIRAMYGKHCSHQLVLWLRHSRKSSISKGVLTVRATYRWKVSTGNLFLGGFILGGLVIGTLGCVYAPQISSALAGTDKKDLMRKLPKFIYDEDKALEKQRKKLSEKIAQLNSAIDDVSNQLRSENTPNGADVNSDEVEALI
nr:uncharacterized protein LOC113712531 [Coffea arabica]